MKKVRHLYEQFQPENYQLNLVPDRAKMTFKGTVTISGRKVGRPSQRLTFHQKELKITAASLVRHDKKGQQEFEVTRINNQDSFDEVRLHTDKQLFPGKYTVTLKFEGQITRPMNGIYTCYFKHQSQDKMLIATQFESHHAREAFPCVDEPEAKATFDLTLTTPADETVLSNTPVKQQKTTGRLRVTKFETTPRMSVYLLAFVYGELGFSEARTKDGVTVRCYATPDNAPLTKHALDVAVKALEFFGDYFDLPYPLAKLDMVALPDFSSGAMENWGLVTYRETAMLVDPKSSSIESKQLVALVVCHELSHQWFGNLVTMKWWDDLWLNESFANLMEYRAVAALYPEWQIWEQFVSLETGSAKRRDSLADVQTIKTAVNHPDEISTLFDPSIVYAKGGSVLHMLLHYIGEDAFRQGLKAYFDHHRYGNTTANDLWQALGQTAKQDISEFMNGWLTQPGYPLISVEWQPGQHALQLRQQRFLSDPAAKVAGDQLWQVPLASTWSLESSLLSKPAAEIKVSSAAADPLLLNHDGQSYFLPRYANQAHREHIIEALRAAQISNIDRLLLIDNYTMLQRGGQVPTTELLDLLLGYKQETNESVWSAMAGALAEARKLVETDEPAEKQLNQLINDSVLTLLPKLGWDDHPDDTAQTLRLRGLIYALAAGAKNQSIIDEGLKRCRSFKQPSDLPASTRGTIYFIGARYGEQKDFKKLLRLYQTIQNADEKDELASGLTSVKRATQFKQLLELLTTDTIRRQDLMHWFVWLLRNRWSRPATWQWLVEHWDWIEQEFKSDKSYSFFARYSGSIFTRPDELKQFQRFFDDKRQIVALSRDIALAEQEISSRIAWRQRNETTVKDWLKRYPR